MTVLDPRLPRSRCSASWRPRLGCGPAELAGDLAGGGDLRIVRHRGPRGADHRRRRPGARLDAQRGRPSGAGPPGPRRRAGGERARRSRGPSSSSPTTSRTAAGPRTLLVGVEHRRRHRLHPAILGLVVIGLPILLLVVAATTWAVVGRALAPVEADPPRGRLHLRRRAAPPRPRSTGRRRDRPARPHHEQDAEPARARPGPAAPVRLRRLPRTAHPGRVDPPARRGRPRPPATQQPAQTWPKPCWPKDLRMQRLVTDLLLLAASDERSARCAGAPSTWTTSCSPWPATCGRAAHSGWTPPRSRPVG